MGQHRGRAVALEDSCDELPGTFSVYGGGKGSASTYVFLYSNIAQK